MGLSTALRPTFYQHALHHEQRRFVLEYAHAGF
jgi:hypothetical protein